MKCYLMNHSGGLDEAVQTIREISWNEFARLICFYKPYAYDDRINCYRFITNDMEDLDRPTWLLIGYFNYGSGYSNY